METEAILDKLQLNNKKGHYKNHFYVIELTDSNEYASIYSLLDKNAINTEYPNFAQNTNKATVKITNYFEIEVDNVTYNIFLIADFDNDKYYVKIGEGLTPIETLDTGTSDLENL